ARPAGESVCVIAIGGDNIIVVTRSRDRTAHDGFLADVKMAKSTDLLRLILLARAFLKTPYQQHQRQHLDFVALLRRRHGNQAVCGSARLVRDASAFRLKLTHITKRRVKKRSLSNEFRKNIHAGVALYSGRPTVIA